MRHPPFADVAARIDRVPFPRAVAVGLAAGLALAAGIALLPPIAGVAAAVVVIALAGAAAWSAQPVGIWEPGEEEPFLDMVAIGGGSFWMGSPWWEPGRDSDEKRHRVTVSPFRMSRTTVTRVQNREVMGLDEAPGPGSDDHPVTEVSWFQAVEFCNRLSEREGLAPCYRIDGKDVSWIEDAGGYRLPTEAEWEHAARAGSRGRWPFWRWQLKRFAWYSSNSGGQSHRVATLRPNPWGLFDMHGNVWEWCWDGFAEYPAEHLTDPRGPESPSAQRVLRGGSAWHEPWNLRSAYRRRGEPEGRGEFVGFRCVRRPRRQP